jgi:MoaA/NifB/PqqE/SkfB family radical SAM enzyme
MSKLERLKGYLGQKINGVSFNIDILNACSLRCPSCAVGSIGKRGGERMSIGLFRKILDKAESECKIRHIQLYAYSDPCLHPDLDLFVSECTKRGIKTWISTMLQSTKCDFRKVIEAKPFEFRISFPGFEKMEYYQKGAKVERFKQNIESVCKLPRHPETVWTMVWHLYKDNQHEESMVRDLAEKHRLKLVIIPAIFMPCEKIVEDRYTFDDDVLIEHLIETPEESIARMTYPKDYCKLWKQVTIDAAGMVYLCQIVYEDRFRLMPFLDLPLKEIQKTIRNHDFCGKCMSKGAHAYQLCYADIATSEDPVGTANKLRGI